MEVSGSRKLVGVPFEEYLKIPAESHSGLKYGDKNFGFESEKMRVGKIVDAIITGGEINKSDPLYLPCLDIANKLKADIGEIPLSVMSFQASYLSKFIYDGFFMDVKGRPDIEIGKKMTIDIKLTEEAKSISDCIKIIEFMKYDNQLFGYKKMSGIPLSYVIMYSKKIKKTFFIRRLDNQESNSWAETWWEEKIIEKGRYLY